MPRPVCAGPADAVDVGPRVVRAAVRDLVVVSCSVRVGLVATGAHLLGMVHPAAALQDRHGAPAPQALARHEDAGDAGADDGDVCLVRGGLHQVSRTSAAQPAADRPGSPPA